MEADMEEGAIDLRPTNYSNIFSNSAPAFPQFIGPATPHQGHKPSDEHQLPSEHEIHASQISQPEDFSQHSVNPNYSAFPSSSPSSTPVPLYYSPESQEAYSNSKAYIAAESLAEHMKNNSELQSGEAFLSPRSEESYPQIPHALKHLTDSLSIETHYQHPREHLQQFLQHQKQHFQQSLTSHMINALNQNGGGGDNFYNKMINERNSPITRPHSHVSSSDSSNTNTPCNWQENSCAKQKLYDSQPNPENEANNHRFTSTPSPVFQPNSPPPSLQHGMSFQNRGMHHLLFRKKMANFNHMEEDSTEFSRGSGLPCSDLPLEMSLHENEKQNTSYDILDKSVYSCSLCSFTCHKQIELTNHVGIHPDDKPFHCPHCEYKGSKYNYLKNHLLIHGTQKVHECPHCEYKSYQRGAVKVHMRKHSVEKKYGCPSCPYRTHFNGNLKLHIRVHTGEKPYVCPVCEFRCTQSGSLKIHMRGHSGEKPYACSACDYKTKHKGNLVMHQRKHSGERPFRCDQCSYATTQRMGLTKHKKTVHGVDPPPNKGRYPHQIMLFEQLQSLGSPPPHSSMASDQSSRLNGIPPHLLGSLKHSPFFLPKSEPLVFHE